MKQTLAAIFYADVVGYSKLAGSDESTTHERLNRGLDRLTRTIEQHDGRKSNEAGDAILAEFPSVLSAVEAAIAFQQDTAAENLGLDADDRFEFRIGIHLGEVIHDRGDIFGDGVNLAARIQTAAEPGGLCISAVVHELIRGKTPQPFHDRGFRQFKNITDPVQVFSLNPSDLGDKAHPAGFLDGNVKGQPLFDLDGSGLTGTAVARGGCLCRHVTFEISEPQAGAGFCHCSICRRALGAPINAWVAFPQRSVHFHAARPTWYQSSPIARRGFCNQCGTSLTYQLLKPEVSEYLVFCIAAMDQPERYSPVWHGGIESQLPWMNPHDDLPRLRSPESPSLRKAWAAAGVEDPSDWQPEGDH